MEEWPDLVFFAAFSIVTIGHFSGVPWFRWIANQVMWWWPYELLGTFFLVLCSAFLDGMPDRLATPRRRTLLLVSLFAVLTFALHLFFRLPLRALALSGLLLLPSHLPVLGWGGRGERTRHLYRGGRAFCMLVLSFFPLGFLVSMLEGPGVRTAGRAIFEGSTMVLWGAFYFLFRALFEAFNRAAAVSLGDGRDPQWGGKGDDT
jgi:hypothetical protein